MDFINNEVCNEGLSGLDIAEAVNGKLYLIESNRTPKWEEFDTALQINTAEKLLNHIVTRCVN